jgi:predicted RNA methylase
MTRPDPFVRRPIMSPAQVDELLERVCSVPDPSDRSRTQLSLLLPRNGKWNRGAFGSIDASEALMGKFGTDAIYSVPSNEKADRHYYLELVERIDGHHDLYLRYQMILGQRLLGGVSQAQIEKMRARFEGRLPLPSLTPAASAASETSRRDRLAGESKQIDSLLDRIENELFSGAPSAPEAGAPSPITTRRAARVAGPAVSAEKPTLHGASIPDAAASRSRRVDEDVLAVLRAGRTESNRFYLGPERLDPKLYKRVNAVLKDLGGAWKGGKTQAHVFEGEADEAVAAVVASVEYLTAKDFGFFPTPAGLAERAVALAGLAPGMKVLEPSAGEGSLALRAAAIVGLQNVTACEYLERNVAKLKAAGLTNVIHGDFLALDPTPIFQAVILNPPFSNGQDMKHVEHAARFLAPDGVLIAIMSRSFQTRGTSAAAKFRAFADTSQAEVEAIPAGTFRESGTEVATLLLRMDARNFPWNAIVELDEEIEEEMAEAPRG